MCGDDLDARLGVFSAEEDLSVFDGVVVMMGRRSITSKLISAFGYLANSMILFTVSICDLFSTFSPFTLNKEKFF